MNELEFVTKHRQSFTSTSLNWHSAILKQLALLKSCLDSLNIKY